MAAGIYVAAPAAFFAALPLLFLAACPLSMILMMKIMNGDGGKTCSTIPCSQPAGATPAQPVIRDQFEAELQRLQARQSAIADQIEGARRQEAQQM